MTNNTTRESMARLNGLDLWPMLAIVAVLIIPLISIAELFYGYPHLLHLRLIFVVLWLLSITIVVTEVVNTRRYLQRTAQVNERLRMALEAGKSLVWEREVDTGLDTCQGDLKTVFGISPGHPLIQCEDFLDFVHTDDRDTVSKAIKEAQENHSTYHTEFRIRRKDATEGWINATGRFHYDHLGRPERMLALASDITEYKSVESALKRSEEKFARAFLESPMAFTLTSLRDRRYLDVNETFERITGWNRTEVIGRTPFDIHLWVNPSERVALEKRIQIEGGIRNAKIRFRCRDGREGVGLVSSELINIEGEPCLVSVIADVTDQEKMEAKLHESEERLRGIIDSAMDAIVATDENQQIVLFNAAAESMFGISASEAIGTNIERFIPERFRSRHQAHFDHFGESGIPGANRKLGMQWGLRKGVEEFPIEVSISRLEIDSKQLFTAIIRDITERQRYDDNLRSSERRLRLALEAGRLYVDEWDTSTDIIVRSPEYSRILGPEQPAQLSRRQLLAQIHSDDRETFENSLANISLETPTFQVIYRLLLPHNHTVWLEKTGIGLFDSTGRLVRAIGVVTDITSHKRAEEALRASEERFRRVVEHIGDALIIDDVAGNIVYANDRFLELFRFSREQLPGMKLESYVAPECVAELRDRHDRRVRGEAVASHFEYEGVRLDGVRMSLEVDVVAISDETGKFIGTQSAIRDITERKRAERLLRESEERFRLVANSAPVMIWMSGMDRRRIYINNTYLEFTRRRPEEELGDGWKHRIKSEDLSSFWNIYAKAFDQRETFQVQYRLQRHDGEYRWVEDRGVPRFDADGSFAGYIGSIVDITDRKLAEEALSNIGRRLLEAQETERTWIARELHDDINQRLALLAVELGQWRKHGPQAAQDFDAKLGHAQKHLIDVSNDLQALSHRLHSSKLEYLGLAPAVESFCRELSEKHGLPIEFRHSNLPTGLSQEIALTLFRVMQEALQNALKHSGSGRLRVEFYGARDAVDLAVIDQGAGFNQDAAQKSAGLGLISMRERLHLIHGSLMIESEKDRGTTVRAHVPLMKTNATEVSSEPSLVSPHESTYPIANERKSGTSGSKLKIVNS